MDNLNLFFLIFGLSKQSSILDTLMIFGAEYLIYLAFLLAFTLIFKGSAEEKKSLLLVFLTLPIVVIFIKIIHLFFIEPRPFISYHISPLVSEGANASFPSRHAAIMSTLAFAYVYYNSKWALLFLFLMIWVGISRIYVGIHYPLDIIGGFIVGIVSLMIAKQIVKLLKLKFSHFS